MRRGGYGCYSCLYSCSAAQKRCRRMPKRSGELTLKEKCFCEEFVRTGNATQAYLTTYGGTYNTANAQGWRTLQRPRVHEYVAALQKQAWEAACISAERVGLKLAEIDFDAKDDEQYTPTAQLRALDLLQKQMGLQHQKIEADVSTDINITIEE